MSLEQTKRKLNLMYGLKSVYLIRFKDANCSHDWISFFTTNEKILSNRVIKDHHKHEGFEIHIVEMLASQFHDSVKRDS